MKVLFVAGFGPIVRDMDASLRFYRETIGLPIVITPWMREGGGN